MKTLASVLNGRRLCVTDHAAEEAVKDFGIEPSRAASWVAETARKAMFISGRVMGFDRKHSDMYGYNRICFIVRANEKAVTIVTVYPARPGATLRDRVENLLARELRKVESAETKLRRRNERIKAEFNVEIAILKLKMLRARSEATRLACQARINAINEYFTQLDADLLAVKHEKRAVAKTVAAYL
ncbi:hypothetical protein V5G20_17995 [Brevibacillus borstelensis]|uniref:hypothetical protein n=1 Tax=Brevibacillus borstelensis TaxID=45462 RepID=UPI0030CDD231